ncbi:uncharacterized protein LOC106734542 isoform X2 [Tupaia chinensis]|uniref:uncharacterized protein LOC106734542 isoform X1 n=1 Tax=Tupaia chinensis TaxID=246437 RepID=UPI000703DAC7|nr:uncharacterized protein LOC106734542 isoform X1 [Tupaia chinensis]XP_027626287.1 uncharacterized protein LOC106734542 isoform X2 [Tupaia chinensis]
MQGPGSGHSLSPGGARPAGGAPDLRGSSGKREPGSAQGPEGAGGAGPAARPTEMCARPGSGRSRETRLSPPPPGIRSLAAAGNRRGGRNAGKPVLPTAGARRRRCPRLRPREPSGGFLGLGSRVRSSREAHVAVQPVAPSPAGGESGRLARHAPPGPAFYPSGAGRWVVFYADTWPSVL